MGQAAFVSLILAFVLITLPLIGYSPQPGRNIYFRCYFLTYQLQTDKIGAVKRCDSCRVAPFFISLTLEESVSNKAYEIFIRFLRNRKLTSSPRRPSRIANVKLLQSEKKRWVFPGQLSISAPGLTLQLV